tara:strand:- start:346 stop:513 length:168 start_codon:yes stop_codon:yes gene_type:complete
MEHLFNQIEIRIEKIFDREDNLTYYWCYARIGEEVKLIGKSKTPPPVLNYDVFMG